MNDPARLLSEHRKQQQLALNVYEALRSQGEVSAHRLLAYRCRHRCLVLDVVDTPLGRLLAFPRYKTSPERTANTSSASGRAKNTEDGNGRWVARVIVDDGDVGTQVVTCDTLDQVPLLEDHLRSDLAARHAEVVIRPDGTRYAVR